MTEELFKSWDHVLFALKDASMDKTQSDKYTMIQSLNKELTIWLLLTIFYECLLRPSGINISNHFKALFPSVCPSLSWCIAVVWLWDAKRYQSKNKDMILLFSL